MESLQLHSTTRGALFTEPSICTIDDASEEPRARAEFRPLPSASANWPTRPTRRSGATVTRGFADAYEDLAAEVEADGVGRAPTTRSV